MGDRLALDLQEISHDPTSLSQSGFWAVTTSFEGEWTCARFGRVVEAPFPSERRKWTGITGEWFSTFSETEYVRYVESIRDTIAQGIVYQVNACRELSAPFDQQSLAGLMSEMLKSNPAPFASYLRLPGIEIASASPELFLQLADGEVVSGPIKGTKALNVTGLDFGSKDVAENIMIVDLIRNDFGRICETGSISVPHLLQSQNHPGLSHLVSFVSGRLRESLTWSEISAAIFPPGSVSGAPKLSAVATIKEHEARDRGPYCGALGWVEGASALLSVAIRIFWTNRDGIIRFGTGAGITWGSDAQQEWYETELKAARLLSIARGESQVSNR
ncbi:MAG: chorismate-binding protein [Actinobacteria bacterium]|nr:chorismate-binding protein [Actinomycetota bacterium]